MVTVLIVLGLAVLPLQAQTTPKDVPQKSYKVNTGKRAYSASLRGDSPDSMNRWFEFRGGIRVYQIDGKIRPGDNGSSQLDLKDDLGLDGVEIGPQLDFEMQVGKRWYGRFSYAGTYFNGPTITTTRTLIYQSPTGTPNNPSRNPVTLAPGSVLQTKLDMDAITALTWYEAFRTDSFMIGPSVGLKALFFDETITIRNVTTGVNTIDQTETQEVTPLVGLEARYQFNRNVYLGISSAGFALDKYFYIGGQGYVGFDYDKTWGMRLGVDVDHITTTLTESSRYAASTTITAAFVQGVYGF